MAAGTVVGPVRRAAARPPRLSPRAPAGLSQAADRGPDHLRKADPGPAVRLLLYLDRRLRLRCHHDPGPPQRVDQGRDLRGPEDDRPGVL